MFALGQSHRFLPCPRNVRLASNFGHTGHVSLSGTRNGAQASLTHEAFMNAGARSLPTVLLIRPPLMKERGYSEDEIDAILVRNPRRLLTFA
jgi:predicted metal-dependent phosphotriesterase family hydrolase